MHKSKGSRGVVMLKTVFKQSNIFCFSEDDDEEMDIAGVNLQVFSVFQQCTMWYCLP